MAEALYAQFLVDMAVHIIDDFADDGRKGERRDLGQMRAIQAIDKDQQREQRCEHDDIVAEPIRTAICQNLVSQCLHGLNLFRAEIQDVALSAGRNAEAVEQIGVFRIELTNGVWIEHDRDSFVCARGVVHGNMQIARRQQNQRAVFNHVSLGIVQHGHIPFKQQKDFVLRMRRIALVDGIHAVGKMTFDGVGFIR